jgi:hypothetical protein
VCKKTLVRKKPLSTPAYLCGDCIIAFSIYKAERFAGFLIKFGFPFCSLAPPSMDDNLSSSGDILRLGLFTIKTNTFATGREKEVSGNG